MRVAQQFEDELPRLSDARRANELSHLESLAHRVTREVRDFKVPAAEIPGVQQWLAELRALAERTPYEPPDVLQGGEPYRSGEPYSSTCKMMIANSSARKETISMTVYTFACGFCPG